MKGKRHFVFFLFLFTGLVAEAQGQQENRFINKRTLGGFLSTGIPLYQLADGTYYQPIIAGFSYHLPLFKTNGPMNIAIDILPQAALVPFKTHMEYEYGLNIGFTFGFQLATNTVLSYTIGSGPHYISSDLERQAKGFIFSDNMYITLRRNYNGLDIGVFSGMRHISNADLELPNDGVNNILIGVTIAKILKPSKD